MEYDEVILKKRTLETFSFFIRFCEHNNLRYFAAFGTLLGAIRHNGFIPWDDDIDVFMPRDDYERLKGMKSSLVNEGYKIFGPEDDGYYMDFIKIAEAKSTIWEMERFPFVFGVYIDIFPLEFSSLGACDIDKALLRYDNLKSKLECACLRPTFPYLVKLLLTGRLLTLKENLLSIFYYRKRRECIVSELNEIVDRINNAKVDNCDKCVILPFMLIVPSSWFNRSLKHSFEDLNIRIPGNSHEFLKFYYGDYMQFPPEDKRRSHHSHYYVDLDHSLTVKEIKKRK